MTIIVDEDRDSQFLIKKSNESFLILAEVEISVTGEDAIFERKSAARNEIQVLGFLNAIGDGFAGIRSEGRRSNISLIGDGSPQSGEGIVADIGVEMLGDEGRFFNSSGIDAVSFGIRANGASTRIVNQGFVEAEATAIDIRATSGIARLTNEGVIDGVRGVFIDGPAIVKNSGVLSGDDIGIEIRTKAGETSSITNSGGVIAAGAGDIAIKLGAGDDHVVNSAAIGGRILLGGGDDSFESTGGDIGDIEGGKGNDTYILGTSGDVVETANGGIDLVRTSVDRTLEDNVENLTLIGAADVSALGNSGDNRLIGNAGSNSVAGFEGNDILTGKGGEDTFRFFTGFGKDIVTDYKPDIDGINLEGWLAIEDFDDLIDNHLKIDGKDLIFKAGSDSLTLKNVDVGDLSPGDFMFQA